MTPSSMRRALSLSVALALAITAVPNPAVQAAAGGAKSITASDLKTWLSAISSDEFEGRATFTEGLGLAASYIAGELRAMGVKPGGDKGS
ncbi:MAG TPA: aminopeptidase, partial [Vicinamibacteria bacterium]|nr:aminopeptidase [Vicinamibacteria bacterium]